MAQVASEIALELAHTPTEDGALDMICVGVFTVGGSHMADIDMNLADTVLDLKREIGLVAKKRSAPPIFRLVCRSAVLSNDEQTLQEAGVGENPMVQFVTIFAIERFVSEGESGALGLYLIPDGSAEVFSVSRRTVNREEDEEHTQRIFFGEWKSAQAEGTGNGCVTVVFTQLERNVYNEAAMAGWTSRSGRKHLADSVSLELWREEGGVRLPDNAKLEDFLSRARVWFPAWVDCPGRDGSCTCAIAKAVPA
uniref:Ubiquitin-like domain-containing protein n=1 Tax=Alexandrium monilatum TaxID=311494 RepID=A0A7S4SYA9_9DINO